MARLPVAQQNAMLDAAFVTATVYYLSIHSADPGTTGANEITGYTGNRPAITFLAASGGSKVSGGASPSQTFAAMPAEAGGVPFAGVWDAASGGTYKGGMPTTGLAAAVLSGSTITFALGQVSWNQT